MLEHSTQYINWCFVNKEKDLENLKQQKITKYRKIYQKVLNKNPQAEIQLFGIDDENVILNFYVSQLVQTCQSFPLKVEAAAISYFKRFFLKTTLLSHDPKKYLFPCVYLALKTEEIHIDNFEHLARQFRDPFFAQFPDTEQDILKVINFDLKIYNPYTPLLSLLERLKEDEKIKWDLEKFNRVYNESIKITRICFYDYLVFEVPHGLISLAAFLIALKRTEVEWQSMPALADFANLNDDVRAEVERVQLFVEKYEVFGIKEEAIKALKKLKNYHSQKPKDDFVKPEKHHHPNPPSDPQNALANAEKKPPA